MTRAASVKKDWGWESDVPRCVTCVHFKSSAMFLVNSLPRKVSPFCKKGDFNTRPMAVCRHWTDRKTGDTLVD